MYSFRIYHNTYDCYLSAPHASINRTTQLSLRDRPGCGAKHDQNKTAHSRNTIKMQQYFTVLKRILAKYTTMRPVYSSSPRAEDTVPPHTRLNKSCTFTARFPRSHIRKWQGNNSDNRATTKSYVWY